MAPRSISTRSQSFLHQEERQVLGRGGQDPSLSCPHRDWGAAQLPGAAPTRGTPCCLQCCLPHCGSALLLPVLRCRGASQPPDLPQWCFQTEGTLGTGPGKQGIACKGFSDYFRAKEIAWEEQKMISLPSSCQPVPHTHPSPHEGTCKWVLPTSFQMSSSICLGHFFSNKGLIFESIAPNSFTAQ